MNHRESLNTEKALTGLETASLTRGFLLHAVLVADATICCAQNVTLAALNFLKDRLYFRRSCFLCKI
jgi:hypothetical protein